MHTPWLQKKIMPAMLHQSTWKHIWNKLYCQHRNIWKQFVYKRPVITNKCRDTKPKWRERKKKNVFNNKRYDFHKRENNNTVNQCSPFCIKECFGCCCYRFFSSFISKRMFICFCFSRGEKFPLLYFFLFIFYLFIFFFRVFISQHPCRKVVICCFGIVLWYSAHIVYTMQR